MRMKRFASALLALILLSVTVDAASSGNIVLRLMGDSTMADKDLSYGNPERGWGQRLKSRVDTCVTVANYAQNGRSTKSFITLGLWDKVKSDLSEGDWLLIQFGHNDSKESDTTRYAAPYGAYSDNLRTFVSYALEVGAKPVLLTPVSRRWFDDEGRLKTECHGDYPDAMKKVAEEFNIPLITYEYREVVKQLKSITQLSFIRLLIGLCAIEPGDMNSNTGRLICILRRNFTNYIRVTINS